MKIHVLKNKHWYFKIVADNGQTILTSETYYSKFNAVRQARKMAKMRWQGVPSGNIVVQEGQ